MVSRVVSPTTNRVVLVAGVSGGIGKAFYRHYLGKTGVVCFGIGRKKTSAPPPGALELLDKEKVQAFVDVLPLESTSEITYIHCVGIDKFEPEGKPQFDANGDGIDDDVFSSNVTTLKNALAPLVEKAGRLGIPVTVVNVCSISDVYVVPLWQSYSRAKNIVRQYMKEQPLFVRSVILNVSSINADLEKFGRPFANTTYWLKPNDLLERALPIIEQPIPHIKNIEVDIFNSDPAYCPDYFTNIPKLLEKWIKEIGYSRGPIPLGIRI